MEQYPPIPNIVTNADYRNPLSYEDVGKPLYLRIDDTNGRHLGKFTGFEYYAPLHEYLAGYTTRSDIHGIVSSNRVFVPNEIPRGGKSRRRRPKRSRKVKSKRGGRRSNKKQR